MRVPDDEHVDFGVVQHPRQLGAVSVAFDAIHVRAGASVPDENANTRNAELQVRRQLRQEVYGARGEFMSVLISTTARGPAIVISADALDVPLAKDRDGPLGELSPVDQVARANDVLAPQPTELPERVLKRIRVGVDIGDDAKLGCHRRLIGSLLLGARVRVRLRFAEVRFPVRGLARSGWPYDQPEDIVVRAWLRSSLTVGGFGG